MIELSMALVIMGIIGSVAVLSLRSSVTHSRLQLTVDRLTSDLHLVRDQALRDQKNFAIVFNEGQRSYSAAGVRSSIDPRDISVSLADPQYGVSALALSGAGNNITFDFRGRCPTAITITLQSGPQQRAILVTTEGSIEAVAP